MTGCGEYIPETVVYTEVPTTHIYYTRVYDYPRYKPYYYRIEHKKHRPDPRIRPSDNRNNRHERHRRR